MADDWKTGFAQAVADVLLKKGTPVETPDEQDLYTGRQGAVSIYGWTYGVNSHPEYKAVMEHRKICDWKMTNTVTDVNWSEFQDTEAPNRETHALLGIFSCRCGRFTEVWFVLEADFGTLLRELLND